MPKKKPLEVDRHVGGRIRQARLMAQISQEKLGEAIGLTFQQVQKYEKGSNRVSASRLDQIARTLGRPIAWFFEGIQQSALATQKVAPDPLLELAETSDGIALARAWNEIHSAKMRKSLLGMAQAAAEDFAPSAAAAA